MHRHDREDAVRIIAVVIAALAAAILLLSIPGCSALYLLPPARQLHPAQAAAVAPMLSSAACAALSREVTAWTATTVVASVLGGGSGVSAIFTAQTPRIAIASTGVGLATLSALSAYLSARFAANYAQGCTVNVGGAP